MMWKCKECGDDNIPADRLMLHLRLFHLNELPEKWPDGGLVFLEWDSAGLLVLLNNVKDASCDLCLPP